MSIAFIPATDPNYPQRPFHAHDCDMCKFIALIHMPSGPCDLYTCGKDALLRRSSIPSDYSSWPLFLLTRTYMVADSTDAGHGYTGTPIIVRAVLEANGVNFGESA